MGAVRAALEATDANRAGALAVAGQPVALDVEGETVSLAPDELAVERVAAEGLSVVSDFGCTVAVDTTVTRDLLLEGLMRDFVRHVQNLRKEADFEVTDRIALYYEANGDLTEAIAAYADYIRTETLATQLTAGAPPAGAAVTETNIGGHRVQIGVLRIAS
jgi:isoleucyl-tRNA synthetase